MGAHAVAEGLRQDVSHVDFRFAEAAAAEMPMKTNAEILRHSTCVHWPLGPFVNSRNICVAAGLGFMMTVPARPVFQWAYRSPSLGRAITAAAEEPRAG